MGKKMSVGEKKSDEEKKNNKAERKKAKKLKYNTALAVIKQQKMESCRCRKPLCVLSRRAQSVCVRCLYCTHPTLIMGAESTVTMIVISHKMESKPVLVADDGRRDITA